MNASELRDAILGMDDLPRKEVPVPQEWASLNGARLYIRGMTAGERDVYLSEIVDLETQKPKAGNWTALLVVRTLVDEEGKRVFADDDAAALAGKSPRALDALAEVARELSGLSGVESADFSIAQSVGTATS